MGYIKLHKNEVCKFARYKNQKELSQNLREKDVSIKDFGTFKKIIQPARIARNPATGEPVEVPEKEVVKFKPSKNILNMKWL